jgi:hypothetical protein
MCHLLAAIRNEVLFKWSQGAAYGEPLHFPLYGIAVNYCCIVTSIDEYPLQFFVLSKQETM